MLYELQITPREIQQDRIDDRFRQMSRLTPLIQT